MAVNLVIRLIGSLALGAAGFAISLGVSGDSSGRVDFMPWGLALTLGGLLLGGVIAPYVVRLIEALNRVPAATLISSTIGLVSGLIVAALVSIPLFNLDSWFSWGFPLIISFDLGLPWILARCPEAGRSTKHPAGRRWGNLGKWRPFGPDIGRYQRHNRWPYR